ncbi:hypothetical protein [Actibacterium lipolyticum]|uniref:Uncharacterized protein n=1 Tax=Actibacterium lipolyticum TaxID=1524263 RepID=A0A238JMS4_9RHOB|nr:hypothetical protein [Actibacterium lipolyticum]SMX31182.1 hypothetical protein COL8621_00319 [Actibacterium lipolyticum]
MTAGLHLPIKALAAIGAILSATSLSADTYCVRDVVGGEAKLPVEIEQPYRIASDPITIPGFDGLVFKAVNRHQLYEYDGSRYNLIESDFPHVWGFAFEHGIHVNLNGNAYGFGSKPKVIFYHQDGTSSWEPIEATRDYWDAFFDQGAGEAYFRTSRRADAWNRIVAGRVQPQEPLPIFHGDITRSVRTVPEISGAFALTGGPSLTVRQSSSIWFRADGGTWRRIPMTLPDGARLFDTLLDAVIEVSGDLVRIFPENNAFKPLFFKLADGNMTFAGFAPAGDWTRHPATGVWFGWSGPDAQTKRGVERMRPKAFMLGPGEVRATLVENLEPPVLDKDFYLPKTVMLSGEMPAFLSDSHGFLAFDGSGFSRPAGLSYENLGDLPRVRSLGGKHLSQSEKGVFEIKEDLSVVRFDNFPIVQPWTHLVSIDYVDAWEVFVIADKASGKLFASSNMQEFEVIPSTEPLRSIISILDEPPSVLIGGQAGLVSMTDRCPP